MSNSLSAPWCKVMEMPEQWCAHCRKLPDPAPLDIDLDIESPSKGVWTYAKFDGTCSTCKEQFTKGERIRSSGLGGWEGDCCA